MRNPTDVWPTYLREAPNLWQHDHPFETYGTAKSTFVNQKATGMQQTESRLVTRRKIGTMVRRAAAAAFSAALLLLLAAGKYSHPSLLVEARQTWSFHTATHRVLHGKGKSKSSKGATEELEDDSTKSTVFESSSRGIGKAGGKSGKEKSSKSSSSDDFDFTNSNRSRSSKSSKKKKSKSSSDDGTYVPTSTPAPTVIGSSSSKSKSGKGKKKRKKEELIDKDLPQPTIAPVVFPPSTLSPVSVPSSTTKAPAGGSLPETLAPNQSGTATPIMPATLQPVALHATVVPTPTFGIGDLTEAPTIAGATATPVTGGTTTEPTTEGATAAPVASGSTTSKPSGSGESTSIPSSAAQPAPTAVPTLAGTSDENTSAPTVTGQTLAPSVTGTAGGGTPAPTPTFDTGDLTESPAVSGATQGPTPGDSSGTPSPTSINGDSDSPQPTPVIGLNITERSGEVPVEPIEVEASPFRVKYSMPSASTSVDEEQMEEVTILTLQFLGDVLNKVFKIANDKNIDFEYIVGGRTAVSSDFEIFDYEIAASFHPSAEIVPLMTDLDALLADIAFQAPANETLLLELQNLPEDNPYATTTRILYEKMSDVSSSSGDSDGLGVGGIVSIAGAFVLAFLATGMAIAYRSGCIKTISLRGVLRNRTFPIAHLTDKTDQEAPVHDETQGGCNYTSSLESSSLVDHKHQSDEKGCRDDGEEEIEFQYPKRFRKGAYVGPKGLFDAPFEDREKYAEIPKSDEV